MGCDIHLYVEYRIVHPAQTLLELCRRKIEDMLSDIDTFDLDLSILPQELKDLLAQETIRETWMTPYTSSNSSPACAAPLDIWRNYNLFGVLADVRNYNDFPTVPRNEGFPDDACEFVRQSKNNWDGDGHNHCWILASDLLEWKTWNETVPISSYGQQKKTEIVLAEEFSSFLDLIKQLVKEHAGGNPNNLRLIYWFDN